MERVAGYGSLPGASAVAVTFPDVPTIQKIEQLYGVEYKDINFLPRVTV